jgi:hypothetical protein
MPFPLPNFLNQVQRMMTQVLDLAPVERKPSSMKKMYAQFHEWDEKQQVERRHRMGSDLRCDLTETEGPCEHDEEERGQSNGWVYSNDHPQCQAPRQTTGRHPTA